jgi:hypothetical protein
VEAAVDRAVGVARQPAEVVLAHQNHNQLMVKKIEYQCLKNMGNMYVAIH